VKVLPIATLLLSLSSCGYRVGGKATTLPSSVHTIAVPAFKNLSTDYQLGDLFADDVSREFNERTHFQVVRDQANADMILHGSVLNVVRVPQLADPTTGKTTSVLIQIFLSLSLTERSTGKVLFSRPSLVVKDNYELATDPHQLLDESGPGFQRIGRTLARDVVSAVIEGF
jgi:hypothetical protein